VGAAATLPTDGLVSFWDFQETAGPFIAKLGRGRYTLEEQSWDAGTHEWSSNNTVQRVSEAPPTQPFGRLSVWLGLQQMLRVRSTFTAAPLLNIHGDNATLSMVAWVKPSHALDNRTTSDFGHLAGIWSEPISVRTYVMFTPSSSRGRDFPGNHIDAEISRTGGTMQPACRWSTSYALGATSINSSSWYMLAMTFDGSNIRAFVNGSLDYRPPHRLNPSSSPCNETWQNPASVSTWTSRTLPGEWGPGGAPASKNVTDFTVAGQRSSSCADGVKCGGGIGHPWSGLLGGLAIYDRAMGETELLDLARQTGMEPLMN
jgi:hypothetical protein